MSTTLDCELMRDLFGPEVMREIFDSRVLLQPWLDVEVARVEAEAAVEAGSSSQPRFERDQTIRAGGGNGNS